MSQLRKATFIVTLLYKLNLVVTMLLAFRPLGRSCLSSKRLLRQTASAASTVSIEAPLDLSSPKDAAIQRNTDPHAVCVVTGASRGLGLEFTKQLLERTRGTVVAACRGGGRQEAPSPGLANLRRAHPDYASRLSILDLELDSQSSIEKFADTLAERHGGRVDLLLNVAGILHDAEASPRAPERALAHIERDWLRKTFEVNTMGPLMLTQALEHMLKLPRTKRKPKEDPADHSMPPRPPSVVASVSARVGSISDNGTGGWYSYRMSKAALNMATVNMALELKRSSVWCIALHPGTTDTDLSMPFQKNIKPEKLFTTEFSVGKMLSIVEAMESHHTGNFYAWDGQRIEW